MKTVVVADDQASQRVIFEMMLMGDTYQVIALEDGRQVLDYLRDHTPDILVLDVKMAHIDGFSICERVKRVPRLKHVPVLIVTSLDEQAARAGSEWVRADAILRKPINRDRFLKTIRSLLEKAQR